MSGPERCGTNQAVDQARYNWGVDRHAETELARAVLAGEAQAFERFVEHFRSKVFHYSWLMCGKPEDAEEVAQETLLNAFEQFDELREPERVRSWIFRIAKNACLMQRRRSVFAPATSFRSTNCPRRRSRPDSPRPPTPSSCARELRAVLDRVILELPPPYRAVVLLRDIEELSTEETAQILDLRHGRGEDPAASRPAGHAPEAGLLPPQPLPGGPAQPQSHASDPGGARGTVFGVAHAVPPEPCDFRSLPARSAVGLAWSQRFRMATVVCPRPPSAPQEAPEARRAGPLAGAAPRVPIGISGAQRLDRRPVLPVRALLRNRRADALGPAGRRAWKAGCPSPR